MACSPSADVRGADGACGRFELSVVEASPPTRLVMDVRTPIAQSRVTHDFVGLPDGRTSYTKRVEANYRGWLRLFVPSLDRIIIGAVRREVARAGEYAELSVVEVARDGDPR
ncbi:MAG: hypothetical protein ABIM89_08500 [Mycobacteriales bacterium]